MPHPLRLGVNIDHVATIRNARGGDHPDPVRAAEIVAACGGDGITVHLREDRRHIRDADIAALKKFQSEGLLSFGRIPARLLNSLRHRQATHWVTFHDRAWTLAHQLRRKRAERIGPDREKVNAALAESADGVTPPTNGQEIGRG